ncbi:MAG: LysR family transcriptional regulator [Akkermansiaceae bacterium]|nr:LysR family transcriptional regulator [Akkermansiaceae bacterium]
METKNEAEFLNYHHLRYFWAVAREGSLRRASEILKVSQPSMSTQIRLLEEALGEDLFRHSGRNLSMTEFGQLVYGYADEIFNLGGEILRATKQTPVARVLRLNVGIVDSFPKLVSHKILQPLLQHDPPVRLTCHEGKLAELVAQLGTHRLDVVLSDEPASPGVNGRLFNHPLGSSRLTFCATPQLAATLKGRFPRNLHEAPALLPTENCTLRRDLEKWFRHAGITPHVVGEFEDAAMAKVIASNGLGVIAIPSIVEDEACKHYGLVSIGRTRQIESQFYAITAERRFTHPAIQAITGKPKPKSGF